MGPSIKYVTLFLANFDPLPCHTLSHISDSPIFSRPSTKTQIKAHCINSLSIAHGDFCPGGFVTFVRGSFVWKVLSGVVFVHCPFCQNTLYNRKLNITLNFMFHIMINKIISVMLHALDPLPCHKLSHLLGPPPPSSVTYFMDGPLVVMQSKVTVRT